MVTETRQARRVIRALFERLTQQPIALGMAINIDVIRTKDDVWLSAKLKELWEQNLLKSVGLRSSQRLALTIPLTRTHFSES